MLLVSCEGCTVQFLPLWSDHELTKKEFGHTNDAHVCLSVALSEVMGIPTGNKWNLEYCWRCVCVAEDRFSSSAMPSIFQPGNELLSLVSFLGKTNCINLILMIVF